MKKVSESMNHATLRREMIEDAKMKEF